MYIASLSSGALSVGTIAGIAISGVVVLVTIGVVVIIFCYRKTKRSHAQSMQMSSITSTAAVTSEFQSTLPKASAPAPQENAVQPPPSYTTAQQQDPYPHPGDQYKMQLYPQFPEYPPEYPVDPPYPDHAAYPPQQYYPAGSDSSKYYYPQ